MAQKILLSEGGYSLFIHLTRTSCTCSAFPVFFFFNLNNERKIYIPGAFHGMSRKLPPKCIYCIYCIFIVLKVVYTVRKSAVIIYRRYSAQNRYTVKCPEKSKFAVEGDFFFLGGGGEWGTPVL